MVATQIFLEFSPRKLGNISNLTNIFQGGWNQQPVYDISAMSNLSTERFLWRYDAAEICPRAGRNLRCYFRPGSSTIPLRDFGGGVKLKCSWCWVSMLRRIIGNACIESYGVLTGIEPSISATKNVQILQAAHVCPPLVNDRKLHQSFLQ